MQYSTSKYEMLKSLNQSASEIRVRLAKGRAHPYKRMIARDKAQLCERKSCSADMCRSPAVRETI